MTPIFLFYSIVLLAPVFVIRALFSFLFSSYFQFSFDSFVIGCRSAVVSFEPPQPPRTPDHAPFPPQHAPSPTTLQSFRILFCYMRPSSIFLQSS